MDNEDDLLGLAMEGHSSPPPPTFHCFPALPPELRLRIWYLTMQTPKMIALCVAIKYESSPPFKIDSIYARPIVRPLLLVNMEARRAALSTYLPGFYDKTANNVVWINPNLDTLYLDRASIFLFGKYEIAKRIERIALPVGDWEWFNDTQLGSYLRQQIRFLCTEMPALKEVKIVAWDMRKLAEEPSDSIRQLEVSTARVEGWVKTWRSIAVSFLRRRETAIEQFQQVVEQMRCQIGFRASQTSITVRAIALDESGAESSWDKELELSYRYRSYIKGVWDVKALIGS